MIIDLSYDANQAVFYNLTDYPIHFKYEYLSIEFHSLDQKWVFNKYNIDMNNLQYNFLQFDNNQLTKMNGNVQKTNETLSNFNFKYLPLPKSIFNIQQNCKYKKYLSQQTLLLKIHTTLTFENITHCAYYIENTDKYHFICNNGIFNTLIDYGSMGSQLYPTVGLLRFTTLYLCNNDDLLYKINIFQSLQDFKYIL